MTSCGDGGAASLRSETYDDYGAEEASSHSDREEESEEEIEDGVHTATVDYYNPETGYSETYDLDVDVEDGEVVRIDFPNGGWEDDFSPEELDSDGNASVEDYEGRQFDISIDQ